MPNLKTVDVSENMLCSGQDNSSVLESKFKSNNLTSFIYSEQNCYSTCVTAVSSFGAFSANKVCIEPKPNSGSWPVVCASNSYTQYTSDVEFSCHDINVDGDTVGCD
ncbi:hypothetical protein ADUPG1_004389, partial [Aduncisulcus paluster]